MPIPQRHSLPLRSVRKKLILLTDVRGLMLDVNDENSVLHRLKGF